MSSKNTVRPSAALVQQLLQANQQLLEANKLLTATVERQTRQIEQLQGRPPERPLVVADTPTAQPEMQFTDAQQLNEQPEFDEAGDLQEIKLSDDQKRLAEEQFETAFNAIATIIHEGHEELVEKGAVPA
jgi:hypothetical protein